MEAQLAPKNRQELVQRLADLRGEGVLVASEEGELLRTYDEMLQDVEAEKALLEPQYNRRVAEEGEESARAWLAERASELGRRHGEAARAVTDRLSVVTGNVN